MRFARCTRCDKFKYIAEQQKCPTCLDEIEATISVQIDIIRVDSTEKMRTVVDAIENYPSVTLADDGNADYLIGITENRIHGMGIHGTVSFEKEYSRKQYNLKKGTKKILADIQGDYIQRQQD